ncbi:hypothetical protein K9M79_05655 [Candidatus Woesearchaeota archaeon]|nr:hypothetical protein [Candidatus Woesearchaeota archaeon]
MNMCEEVIQKLFGEYVRGHLSQIGIDFVDEHTTECDVCAQILANTESDYAICKEVSPLLRVYVMGELGLEVEQIFVKNHVKTCRECAQSLAILEEGKKLPCGDGLLMGYAAGDLDRYNQSIVEAHLTLCSRCAQDVASIQSV